MDERQVGQNIRMLRLKSGASLTAIAQKAGITKSTLSKIEHGQISSPISTLVGIASALEVKLSEFFQEEGHPPKYVLTRKGKGKAVNRNGSKLGYSYEALTVDFPGKPVEPFVLTVSPGDTHGEFRHGGHEFVYMLSGKVEFTVGDDKLDLRPGDSLYFDPTARHSLKLLSKQPARFLCLFIETP